MHKATRHKLYANGPQTPGAGLGLLSHANVPVLRMKMSDEEDVMRNCLSVCGGPGWLGKQYMYAWAPAAHTHTH